MCFSHLQVVPWNYGADVYYHGVKQDLLVVKDKVTEDTDPDIDNIVGTNKISRSGRIFSPEISLKTVATPFIIPTATPISTPIATPTVIPDVIPATESADTWGKEVLVEPVRTKAHKEAVSEVSKKEMEEILKIIRKSDYNMVEQLAQTPLKISMLALLLCSEAHAKALVKFLKFAHVP